MASHQNRGAQFVRLGAIAALAAVFLLPSIPARAYLTYTSGGNTVRWGANSPNTIWNNATKTLSWSLSTANFPQPNWPTAAQAGAAFQNSYQTLSDALGSNIKFNRTPNLAAPPAGSDGRLQMSLAPNENNDYYGSNIAGAFAVTYVIDDGAGSLLDADIVMNGDPNTFTWSTQSIFPPPAGTNDIEVTSVHEQMHSIGGGHTVYYYAAVWWIGRYPELLFYDRCLGPDDRMLIRTLYPAAPAFSSISGVVTTTGAAAVDRAVIVATNSLGIPQATTTTNASGNYTINVPAGAGYSVTAHHHMNILYNSDINFAGATDFINSNSITVDATANIANQNFTVTAGTPTLTLSRLGLSSLAALTNLNATQTMFLAKGSSTSIKLEFTGDVAAGNITGVNMGPGIVVTTGATAASNNANHVICTVTANVDPAATAGVRNITAMRGAERLFLPSYIEVTDTGGLSVATAPQNPGTAAAPFGTVDQPLLQMNLTASAVEDVRIRKLQFTITGAGTALPDVHLWVDGGTTQGVVDGGDTRVFSGNAYANNPVNETIPVTPTATALFDNMCLTIPAGATRTLLLTGNMPAAGSASYTASFDPSSAANIAAHGMFWGDVIAPTGTTVTGGTVNLGSLAIGGLAQIHTTAPQNPIPVGGSTNETQITLRGTVTSSTGTLGMDVEVQPIGTPFTGTATVSLPTSSASGTQLSANVTGLVSGTAYHWQARATSNAPAASAWVSFGGNAETATDFTVDTSTTPAPAGLQQFESDGVTVIPLGGPTRGYAVLQAIASTNSQGLPVRVEVEVQPSGTAFTGTPQYQTSYAAAGTPLAITFTGPTNDYHWQARCATAFGSVSGFTVFDPAVIHFHLDAIQTIKADAGCAGRASGFPGGGWMLWTAAGATLLLLTLRGPRARKTAATLVVLLCLGAAAYAGEDRPLPRSLADSFEAPPTAALEGLRPEDPGAEAALEPAPAFAPIKHFMSIDAYVGMAFMNMDFKALGTDLINREVSGIGTGVLGVEALLDLSYDWRIGLAAEVAMWGDIRIFSVGPVATWCFSGSHANSVTGISDTEHYLKLAVFYEKLSVSKNNFGDFDASFGVRLGYELRLSLGERWAVTVGAALQYAKWDYAETVVSGDHSIGGFGGLITIGAAYLP